MPVLWLLSNIVGIVYDANIIQTSNRYKRHFELVILEKGIYHLSEVWFLQFLLYW